MGIFGHYDGSGEFAYRVGLPGNRPRGGITVHVERFIVGHASRHRGHHGDDSCRIKIAKNLNIAQAETSDRCLGMGQPIPRAIS